MNEIQTKITESDLNANAWDRKSPAKLAAEILESLKSGVPYQTTFISQIPKEHEKRIKAELKRNFEIWANSWIAPQCRRIIAKAKKKA